jgi:hypothetical protein
MKGIKINVSHTYFMGGVSIDQWATECTARRHKVDATNQLQDVDGQRDFLDLVHSRLSAITAEGQSCAAALDRGHEHVL